MLVLTRKAGQSIVIGDDIEVILVAVEGSKVRLGIRAPSTVPVHRMEIYLGSTHRTTGRPTLSPSTCTTHPDDKQAEDRAGMTPSWRAGWVRKRAPSRTTLGHRLRRLVGRRPCRRLPHTGGSPRPLTLLKSHAQASRVAASAALAPATVRCRAAD